MSGSNSAAKDASAICYLTTNGIGNPWVAAELQYVQESGIPADLYTMRAPDKSFFDSEWAKTINQETKVLYPLPLWKFIGANILAPFKFRGRYSSALLNALFSRRENLRARIAGIAHFFVACYWALDISEKKYKLIHSQWIQSGGTIAYFTSRLLDIPFSFTGHAVDLFRDRCALKDKVAHADFIIAISEFHKEFYISEGSSAEKITVVYCGIDVDQFEFVEHELSLPMKILSFGRLVEKKGFADLIKACAILRDQGIEFHCEIAGSGPELLSLKALVNHFKLDSLVSLTGIPLQQEEIAAWMKQGDIFAQPCCWSSDNDIDGIPRSLMEAMAVGIPCISTNVAGIPDLIIDNESGVLIEANEPPALAKALVSLLEDPDRYARIARGGRKIVERKFNLDDCLEPLVERFRKKI